MIVFLSNCLMAKQNEATKRLPRGCDCKGYNKQLLDVLTYVSVYNFNFSVMVLYLTDNLYNVARIQCGV